MGKGETEGRMGDSVRERVGKGEETKCVRVGVCERDTKVKKATCVRIRVWLCVCVCLREMEIPRKIILT